MLRFVLRPALIAVLMLLVAAPTVPAQSTRNQILRECQNGSLSGDYTAREIRDARSNIPDDVDQYTDCRDVLSRALTRTGRGRRLGRHERWRWSAASEARPAAAPAVARRAAPEAAPAAPR